MKTCEITRSIKCDDTYDVIVIGGGPAGCTAAAAAARDGAKTLIIEQTGMLGGMGTAGLVPAWCPFSDGEKMIYRGLAERVFNESREPNLHHPSDNIDWVPIDPEKLKLTYDSLVTEFNVDVSFFTTLIAVEMTSETMISHIVTGSRAGICAYKGKIYIDATGDGDLAALSGVPFVTGDNDGSCQSATLCFSADNVNSYNFQYSDWRRRDCTYAATPFRHKSIPEHFCINLTSSSTVGFNVGHIEGVAANDIKTLSKAMMTGRIMANDTINDLKRHAPEVFGASRLASSASLMGIREGRRFESEHMITYDDFAARRTFDDEIARNCYFIDIHGQKDAETLAKIAETPHYNKGESHGIPYRSLIPAKVENLLLSGRCVSADRLVYGSIRVMPVCLVSGEAAGAAAAMAADGDGMTRNVDITNLRNKLRSYGAWFK